MNTPENEPRPRRSPRWAVIIGIIVLMALLVGGSIAVFHGSGRVSSAISTPTATPPLDPTSASWSPPGMTCNEAVQKIAQNQFTYILIYREKQGGPAIPANAIMGIMLLPRGVPYQGDPAQTAINSLLQVFGTFPDHDCYPQILTAVKQVNKHLSKSEQVKVGWYYDLG